MLDNLRAMGVFSCVVEQRSFNGAAKKLGITTSAVSQQIRALEQHLNITLLYRSTRQLSLTSAGELFLQSCTEMLEAAERGKIRLNEIQEKLIGDIRISVTPTLAVLHITPALSRWIQAHEQLNLNLRADYENHIHDLDNNLDIVIRLGLQGVDLNKFDVYPLVIAKQVLVASPHYLTKRPAILTPEDLHQHSILTTETFENSHKSVYLTHDIFPNKYTIQSSHYLQTNNAFILKSLCLHGHGICRTLKLTVQEEIKNNTLVQVLPEWKLPEYTFYAITQKQDMLSTKIKRCIELLTQYFEKMPDILS